MTETAVFYIILSLVAILIILAFIIGNEKMVKVLIGNYILAILCLGVNQSLESFAVFLLANPETIILNISYESIANMITIGKSTIVMVIYLILLFILYQKSKIKLSLPGDEIGQKIFSLILVPMTVVSIFLTLEIVLLWEKSFDPEVLQTIASSFTTNIYIIKAMVRTPLWIALHALATIIISTEIKFSIKSDLE
jgi:hypothetical protein